MNAEQILLTNAKADVAMTLRIELRDAAIDVWAERDAYIEAAMRVQKGAMFTVEQVETYDELAQTAEYLEWLAGRKYALAYPPHLGEDAPEAYKMNGVFTA